MKKFFVLLAALLPTLVFGATATLNWTIPTQRENGVALPPSEIGSFKVEYGLCTASNTVPTTFQQQSVVWPAAAAPLTSTQILGLADGKWCFHLKTVDTGGLVSVASLPVSATYTTPSPPKPPVLSTTVTIAYAIYPNALDGVTAVKVGSIAKGKECFGDPIQTQRGEMFNVSLSDVKLDPKYRKKPPAVVASFCAIA